LKIFDVTEPEAVQEGILITHPDGFHNAESVAVNGDVTYIVSGEGSGSELRMLNLMGETAELYTDVLPLGGSLVLDLFLLGDTLVAPQWQGSLFTFDVKEPTTPQLLFGPEDGTPFAMGDLFSYEINEDMVYLPVVNEAIIGGVGSILLSDPANPILQSTFETGDFQVMDMTGGNGNLYILSQGETTNIHILDISATFIVGKIVLPEAVNQIGFSGETLYAACDGWNCQSLYTIDVSDPYAAEITGRWTLNVRTADLVSAGEGLIFLSTYGDGIWLLDVNDPANPYLAGHIELPGDYARLKVVDGVVYAAAFDGGLYVLGVG
jgi:hypothetical protein